MTRFLVLLIIAFIIYYYMKNSLKSNAARDGVQKYKNKKADVANTQIKEIAYIYYSAAKDHNTCNVCMELDGKHLLPSHKILQSIKPPHINCKSHKGCRCTLVYVTQDEEGSRKMESLLKRHGGICDKQTIERELTA